MQCVNGIRNDKVHQLQKLLICSEEAHHNGPGNGCGISDSSMYIYIYIHMYQLVYTLHGRFSIGPKVFDSKLVLSSPENLRLCSESVQLSPNLPTQHSTAFNCQQVASENVKLLSNPLLCCSRRCLNPRVRCHLGI